MAGFQKLTKRAIFSRAKSSLFAYAFTMKRFRCPFTQVSIAVKKTMPVTFTTSTCGGWNVLSQVWQKDRSQGLWRQKVSWKRREPRSRIHCSKSFCSNTESMRSNGPFTQGSNVHQRSFDNKFQSIWNNKFKKFFKNKQFLFILFINDFWTIVRGCTIKKCHFK